MSSSFAFFTCLHEFKVISLDQMMILIDDGIVQEFNARSYKNGYWKSNLTAFITVSQRMLSHCGLHPDGAVIPQPNDV